jgi:quinol monooxygenase YgiN
LFYYFIEIGIKKYKTDEFLDNLRTFSERFIHDSGCLDYNIYRDYHDPFSYTVVGEWETFETMRNHFQTHNFKVFMGAVKVLGEFSELSTAKTVSLTKMS